MAGCESCPLADNINAPCPCDEEEQTDDA